MHQMNSHYAACHIKTNEELKPRSVIRKHSLSCTFSELEHTVGSFEVARL